MKYELEHCIASRLRRLSRIVDGKFRKHFAGTNLTENQITILFALYKTGPIRQGKLGEQLVLERSTMSRNIRHLEKNNLIHRTTDYQPKVTLNNQGIEKAEQLFHLWEKAMDEMNIKLGRKGHQLLTELEAKIR